MPINRLPPIHPGEILQEEFLVPLGMSANALARALHVPPNRITAMLAYCAEIKPVATIKARMFYPRPKVDSEVLEICFREGLHSLSASNNRPWVRS